MREVFVIGWFGTTARHRSRDGYTSAGAPLAWHISILVLLLAFVSPSCDNTFEPKGRYGERLVVFCVLDPSAPCQVVRLESTYDAEGTNPTQPHNVRVIDEAVVRIQTDRKVYTFTDTVVDAGNGSMKTIWVSRDLKPEEGRIYTLTVSVPGYQPVTAETQVPSKPYLDLIPPSLSKGKGTVELAAAAISAVAPPKGFYFRLYVVGDKTVEGKKVPVRMEVPLRVDGVTGDTIYTKPSRDSRRSFSLDIIAAMKSRLEDHEFATNIRLLGVGYSIETHLYNYFQTVRGFDDPVSVRQDRPDVTNIAGGVGVFGALMPDSLNRSYVSILVEK
ncbi:MAG: DUF4249 family protein [Bacteroidota bacterium]|nr:DUF4249 family protein [Bacteroidota bacterium]